MAIIFIIKKPKYVPELAAYDSSGAGRTQNLLSGYPKDRLTVRRKSIKQPAPETAVLSEGAESITDVTAKLVSATAKLPNTAVLDAQGQRN